MKHFLMFFVILTLAILASVPATAQCPANATFFQFDRNLPESHLEAEFSQMAQCGISTVVIVASATLSTDLDTFVQGGLFSGTIENPIPDGRLETFLRLASRRNFKIIVGGIQTQTPWYESQWETPVRLANQAVMRKTLQLYGNSSALVHWYYPIELEVNWFPVYGPTYYGMTRLRDFITDANALNVEFGVSMQVMAAPIFKPAGYGSMPPISADGFADALRMMFQVTGIRMLWPQDGIGAGVGGPTLDQLAPYFTAGKQAAGEFGVQFWDTVEVFTADPNAPDGSWYKPDSPERMKQQIAAVKDIVSGIALWNFGHHLSRQATHWPVEAGALYREYLKTYNPQLAPGVLLPTTYNFFRLYGYGVTPPDAWGDPNLTKLTNHTGGGYGPGGNPFGDWVGVPVEDSQGQLHLVIDIGKIQYVNQVRVLFRSETLSGINFPQQMIVETSRDGMSYDTFGTFSTFPENTSQFSIFWGEATGQNRARYVRVKILYPAGWVMMAEAELYGTLIQ